MSKINPAPRTIQQTFSTCSIWPAWDNIRESRLFVLLNYGKLQSRLDNQHLKMFPVCLFILISQQTGDIGSEHQHGMTVSFRSSYQCKMVCYWVSNHNINQIFFFLFAKWEQFSLNSFSCSYKLEQFVCTFLGFRLFETYCSSQTSINLR